MPNTLMKPDPDQDFYVVWSSVTESPHYWGDRAELLADPGPPEVDADRLARADKLGTSARWNYDNAEVDHPTAPRWLDWNDNDEIYQQEGFVSRDKIRTLCERLQHGQPVEDLLTPFEDDDA